MFTAPSSISQGDRLLRADGTLVYDITLDHNGMIRAYLAGCWTLADVDRYIATLLPMLARSRMMHADGGARVHIDQRDGAVQPAEVNARFLDVEQSTVPADRYAFILGSSLMKLQLKRIISHDNTAYFATPLEASAWLVSDL